MLTLRMLSLVFAATTLDPTAVIGIIVILLIVIGIASSGQRRLIKRYCPYCSRRINYAAPVTRPVRRPPATPIGRRNASLVGNRPRQIAPHSDRRRENAPILSVQRRNGKLYCP